VQYVGTAAGAEAPRFYYACAARLKPCPDTNLVLETRADQELSRASLPLMDADADEEFPQIAAN
jgi:hypothetical protein